MKTTRREFIHASAAVTLAAAHPVRGAPVVTPESKKLDAFQIARRHSIVRDLPSPNFFEGMLLGNGDIGACLVVRPDALGLHIGKNDCWDIRVSEDGKRRRSAFSGSYKTLAAGERGSEEAGQAGPVIHRRQHRFLSRIHAKSASLLRTSLAAPVALRYGLGPLGSPLGGTPEASA